MSKHQQTDGQAGSRARLLLAICAFGTVGLFVRQIDLSSQEIALWRALIALLVLGLILAFTGKLKGLLALGPRLWRFVISGAVMAFNWILLFEAYRHTSIALATLAYYLAPSLMIVMGLVFLKERLTAWQVLCFALSTLGLLLMLGTTGGSPGDLRGILLGLASALLYATVITINRGAGPVDGLLRAFVQFVSALAVMLPFVALRGGLRLPALDLGGWASLITLGVFHTGLCYALYFGAMAQLSGQQVAILSYLDPLVAVLLSILLLGERVQPLQLLGGGLMLAFALLNERGPKRS